jgi:uncharacterized repeat protein (TIGR03803 family)
MKKKFLQPEKKNRLRIKGPIYWPLPLQSANNLILNFKLTSKLIGILLLLTPFQLLAQDVLVGLTSAGGIQNKGTAFTIKSTGTSFTVQKAFARSGTNPNGDLVKGNDGNLYGMTSQGGAKGAGTIFKMTATGTTTILHNFDFNTGYYPLGSLVQGNDGSFYGMTSGGGTNYYGTIFKITSTGMLTVLNHFDNTTTGGNPNGTLAKGSDGNFYGMTSNGGGNGKGTIFKVTPIGILTVLRHLNITTDGGLPKGSLVQGKDGNFYGMTSQGGGNNAGTIFKITPAGSFTVLRNLDNTTGISPKGSLVQASDGNFYGMISSGGVNNHGTIFKMTATGTLTVLHNFDYSTTGYTPYGSLVQSSDGNFYGMTISGGANRGGTIFKVTPAGTLTVLRSLNRTTDGYNAMSSLIRNSDGSFYGMTVNGGSGNQGTIFKISPTGAYSVLVHFPEASKGYNPNGSLVQGKDGNYYGLTHDGGQYGYGTIFKMCNGTFSVIKSLDHYKSGSYPYGSLVQSTDGNFYGMTNSGGTNGGGTIFKITSTGRLTVLLNFDPATTGGYPQGNLVQGSDGNFYGITTSGGSNNYGTIFKMTPTGTLTVLRNFDSTTGISYGSLVQGSDGSFFGMTYDGGTSSMGIIFKITSIGTFTVLNNFNSSNGSYPYSNNLIQGSDGNFYATTFSGGSNSQGSIFKMTPTGKITTLRSLDNSNDGRSPRGSLVQGSDGSFYGMTSAGGTNGAGTIFKVTSTGTFTVLRHLNPTSDGANPMGSLVVQKANPVANAQSVATNEDTPKAITLTGSAPGSPLTYTVVTKPINGTLSGSGANRTYTPKANYTGSDSFTFTVTWGCQTSAPVTVSIQVSAVNDAPVLATIGNKTVAKGATLSFTATATDPDAGQTKTFSFVSAPVGASINATSGAFNWTPSTAGTYTFTVKVTDNGSPLLSDQEQITVTVTSTATSSIAAITQDDRFIATKASLYPNPVNSLMTVQLPVETDQVSTAITDAIGTVVNKNQHQITGKNQLQIEVGQLKPGAYLLYLQTQQGLQTLKFMKR